jgi:hypothetical protein
MPGYMIHDAREKMSSEHTSLSEFTSERGWLRQLCCWRGRREPLK